MCYLDFLLFGESSLHLLLVLLLYVLCLVFFPFLKLLEVLHVLAQHLVALLEGLLSVISLAFEILNLVFDDAVGHGDQEHFLFLLQNIHDGLILAHQVLVLLPHLDDF